MKGISGKLTGVLTAALTAVLMWLTVQQLAVADEQPAQSATESEVPVEGLVELPIIDPLSDTLTTNKNLDPEQSIQYREHRVGGRLERATIIHKNGLTEVYQNNRADTIWNAQENEIGEVPNRRQWVIKAW